jgi:toxin ParE1/3/4
MPAVFVLPKRYSPICELNIDVWPNIRRHETRFADEAAADLERIGDWIAGSNPIRAVTFVDELDERCRHLTDMPQAYPSVPRHEGSGLRRVPHGNYLIFYRVESDVVVIVRVLHAARDYRAILFPEE